MIGLRERFHPLDELPEIVGRRVGEDEGIDAERFRQRQQSLGHITPGCRLLAWDNFRLVPFEHVAPAVAFLVTQPIDFLGIEGRQAAGDALPSQIIFFRRIPHVGDDGVVAAVDAELFSAGLLNQFAGIPKTDGEEFQETGRVGLLPRVVPLFSRHLMKPAQPGSAVNCRER